MGATHTINSKETDPVEAIRELTGGNGVDVAIEAVGNPVTYEQAFLSRDPRRNRGARRRPEPGYEDRTAADRGVRKGRVPEVILVWGLPANEGFSPAYRPVPSGASSTWTDSSLRLSRWEMSRRRLPRWSAERFFGPSLSCDVPTVEGPQGPAASTVDIPPQPLRKRPLRWTARPSARGYRPGYAQGSLQRKKRASPGSRKRLRRPELGLNVSGVLGFRGCDRCLLQLDRDAADAALASPETIRLRRLVPPQVISTIAVPVSIASEP